MSESPRTAYLVIQPDCDGGYTVERIYLDRAEAQAFIEAKSSAGDFLEIEEMGFGAPDVAYDGPIWSVTWSTRRKLKDEKQLVLLHENGFVTVMPNVVQAGAGYRLTEYFAGPLWVGLAAPRYEDPPVWIDNFSSRQSWVSGDHPGEAETVTLSEYQVTAQGTSKEACEALVRATALAVKAELGIT